MFKIAIPILGVSSSLEAERFYCDKLGFRRAYAYRPDPESSDPCYMGVVRDGAHIVLSSFDGDGPPGSRNVQIYVDDIRTVHTELLRAEVAVNGDVLEHSHRAAFVPERFIPRGRRSADGWLLTGSGLAGAKPPERFGV